MGGVKLFVIVSLFCVIRHEICLKLTKYSRILLTQTPKSYKKLFKLAMF